MWITTRDLPDPPYELRDGNLDIIYRGVVRFAPESGNVECVLLDPQGHPALVRGKQVRFMEKFCPPITWIPLINREEIDRQRKKAAEHSATKYAIAGYVPKE